MHKIVSSLVFTALASSLALAYPAHAASPKAAQSTQAATVKEAPLRAHLAFLSSDAVEGRGTGQRGGELTVTYLETQSAAIGLQPANKGSYRQPVKIAGVRSLPQKSNVGLHAGGQPLPLQFGADWVWGPGDAKAEHTMDAELVFVGYGIKAPEEGWDDFKGQDLKG